jgi:Cys-tRNA(Pro) deacylase
MSESQLAFSSTDLQEFIKQHHIKATILPMAEHTLTVPDAARALGVATDQIIKSLIFLVNNEPVLIINNDTTRVDPRKIALHFGISRKKVKFAAPKQALAITGYVVGSMPPFGHKQPLATYIDPAVLGLGIIYGGGGDVDAMLRLTPEELLRVTGAELLDVSKDE